MNVEYTFQRSNKIKAVCIYIIQGTSAEFTVFESLCGWKGPQINEDSNMSPSPSPISTRPSLSHLFYLLTGPLRLLCLKPFSFFSLVDLVWQR